MAPSASAGFWAVSAAYRREFAALQELGLAGAGGRAAGDDQLCRALGGFGRGRDQSGARGFILDVERGDLAIDDDVPVFGAREVADDEIARLRLWREAEGDGGGWRELAAGQIDDGGTESSNLPGSTVGTVGPSNHGGIDGFVSITQKA